MLPLVWLCAVLIVGCGWWFLRNISLYHDLTGARAFVAHYTPPDIYGPWPIYRLHFLIDFLRGIIAYSWLPFEYYNNVLRPSALLKVAIVLFLATAALGLAKWAFRPAQRQDGAVARHTRWLLLGQWLICLAVYVYSVLTQFSLPGRFMVIVAPLMAVGLMSCCYFAFSRSPRLIRTLLVVVVVILLSVSTVVVGQISRPNWRVFPFDTRNGYPTR